MRQHEQKHKAVEWLCKQAKDCKNKPYRRFTPKQVADEIGGVHTALGGRVAQEIVAELDARGIRANYIPVGNKRFFELL